MSSLLSEVQAGLAGRYEVESELGRGGMAVVFLATDVRHGRKVAVKILDPGVSTGPIAQRFQREIRSVAALSHPHILPVLDSGEFGDGDRRAWYVMPYVAGGSLRDRLRTGGPLPVADAVRLGAEIGEALDHAHRQGLIHRDIKPENVLLQDGQAVVADFGIAGIAHDDSEERLTSTGLVMGTAHYMSPEQATGSAILDRRTDIYSMGCVVYEALTGRTPFDAATPQQILARMVSEDAPPVSRDRRAAASLDPILSRALARLPSDRYRTAGEFADALRTSTPAQGLPVSVGQSRTGHQPRRGVLRSKWLWAGAGVALAVVAGTAWTLLDGDVPPATVEPTLAVLPFGNLSPDPEDAYFAVGIGEEIKTQLSKVDGIKLIVGTQDPTLDDRGGAAIARAWGATVILEGSVRRAGDEVRMSFRLIDPVRNDAFWADSFERRLSDIFEVQAEVAARVVEEIRGALTPEERAELMRPSPDNEDALIPYYAGQASFRDFLFSADGARGAAREFGRAVQLDPGFAAAWAGLVRAHLFLAWLWGEPESREEARNALDRLEQLAPGTTELRFARGLWLYFAEQQYEDSLVELDAVAEEWPEDVTVMMWHGAAQRRVHGHAAALPTWQRALERDPTNSSLTYNVGSNLSGLGRHDEAEQMHRRALELNPDVRVHWWGLFNDFLLRGDTSRARVVMDSAADHLGRQGLDSDGWWVRWQVYSGNLAGVVDVYRDIYDQDPRLRDGTWGGGYDVGIAGAAAAGDVETVRSFAESIKARSEEALRDVPDDDPRSRSDLLGKLAMAEAYLGREDQAIRLARNAVDVYAATGDALGNNSGVNLAHVYATLGRLDEAIEQLRQLDVNRELLRISPLWYRLRDHSGFQVLLGEGG